MTRLELIEQFQNQGSGWQFDQVEYFDINIDPFEPLSGSLYIYSTTIGVGFQEINHQC